MSSARKQNQPEHSCELAISEPNLKHDYSDSKFFDARATVAAFHLAGLALELYKTHPSVGSWSYPEDGITKLATVPLYSGFMYSAVGSYISQAWNLLGLRLVSYPRRWLTIGLSAGIYVNFFTNAFLYDFRWWLLASVVAVYARTRVLFAPLDKTYWMPVWCSFGLIAGFVWVAENISTFFGAWQYPNQSQGWSVVEWPKIISWTLLVIISFVLVVELKHFRTSRTAAAERT